LKLSLCRNFYSGYKQVMKKSPSSQVETSIKKYILKKPPIDDRLRHQCGNALVFPRAHCKGIELFSPTRRLLSEHQEYDIVFKAPRCDSNAVVTLINAIVTLIHAVTTS